VWLDSELSEKALTCSLELVMTLGDDLGKMA
jgi:hypothetical protein